MAQTRKTTTKRTRNVPWKGWKKIKPSTHEKTVMMRKCGQKCFLGPNKSFPVCEKGTCKVSRKGVYAAYVRAKQWGNTKKSYKGRSKPRMSRSVYQKVAKTAKKMLRKLKM